MWNLVAEETREAQVYLRLLDKIEEQRRAYKGQVFDLGNGADRGRGGKSGVGAPREDLLV